MREFFRRASCHVEKHGHQHVGAVFAMALLLFLAAAQEPFPPAQGAVLGAETTVSPPITISIRDDVMLPEIPIRSKCTTVSRVTGEAFCFGNSPESSIVPVEARR